jgi:hypothetical protein
MAKINFKMIDLMPLMLSPFCVNMEMRPPIKLNFGPLTARRLISASIVTLSSPNATGGRHSTNYSSLSIDESINQSEIVTEDPYSSFIFWLMWTISEIWRSCSFIEVSYNKIYLRPATSISRSTSKITDSKSR